MNKRILINLFLICTLVLGISSAVAQQYDACDPKNPNYSQECRDENKRDFEKCGEIDYRNVNLWASGRLPPTPPYLQPDPDPYTDKVVFSADIGTKEYGVKSELFRADFIFYKDENGKVHGAANPETQERFTWDATPYVYNADVFFIKDRSLVYSKVHVNKEGVIKNREFFVWEKNGEIRKIDFNETQRLYNEIHNEKGQIVVPPPE